MKELIVSLLNDAIARAHTAGKLVSAGATITVEAPKDLAHGDVASNVALTLAKERASRRGRSPPR